MRASLRLAVWMIACSISALSSKAAQGQGGSPGSKTKASFANPVLWEDLADIDILRVGNEYYYSASNMHYSPGAPILRSYDLVHWEFIGHSIPVLDFSPAYDMQGGHAYIKGSWASFLGYRKSNQTFYWGGCIEFAKTHIYTAKNPEGPWTKHAVLNQCYYDAGLLVDDDDTMYVAYGNTALHVAQLSPDGSREVKSEVVFKTPADIGVLEGSRFYKVNGNYYIFATRPADGEYVLRSTSGPFGPYEMRKLLRGTTGPVPGGGVPHQGGIVETPSGQWYYMAFQDAFPGGRIPVLAPLTWEADGWPSLNLEDNQWSSQYTLPKTEGPVRAVRLPTGIDKFQGTQLGPEWEWNHNPDNAHWSLHDGLELKTASVTNDLYAARNTLTHRILGPKSTATIRMELGGMKDGDRAGLVMLRDDSAWVGVTREGGALHLVVQTGLTMDRKWNTTSTGKEAASLPLQQKRIWLRSTADIRPGPGHAAIFSYSLDGKTFKDIGEPFVMGTAWQFFMGYRFGLFNYATKQLGGVVNVRSFKMTD